MVAVNDNLAEMKVDLKDVKRIIESCECKKGKYLTIDLA